MRKILYIIFIGGTLASCMKKAEEIQVNNDFGSLAVINASPTSVSGSTSGNVYVDGIIQTGSTVAYRGTSGYLSVRPGARNISYIAGTADSAKLVEKTAENFESGKSYTYIIYDTVVSSQTGAARRLKNIRLTDDINLSAKQINAGYVRVLNLAPSLSPVDVTFLRTNVTTPDSVTVVNKAYIGANPSQAQIDALSAFNTTLPLGFNGSYTIKVKAAGTQNVLASGVFNLATQAINQSFVTVYVTGGAQGQPVALGVFRHYP